MEKLEGNEAFSPVGVVPPSEGGLNRLESQQKPVAPGRQGTDDRCQRQMHQTASESQSDADARWSQAEMSQTLSVCVGQIRGGPA